MFLHSPVIQINYPNFKNQEAGPQKLKELSEAKWLGRADRQSQVSSLNNTPQGLSALNACAVNGQRDQQDFTALYISRRPCNGLFATREVTSELG